MAKPELGLKRVCVSCNTRFYDLLRSPVICPKCGTEQPAEVLRPRKPGGNVVDERPKKAETPELEDAEVEVESTEDADAAVIEDTTDLEEGDDLADDIEVAGDDDEEG